MMAKTDRLLRIMESGGVSMDSTENSKKTLLKATIQRYTTLDYGTVGRGARARASREANGIRIHSEMMATSKKGRIERH